MNEFDNQVVDKASWAWLNLLGQSENEPARIRLKSYTVATLPSAANNPSIIYVSDQSTGAECAFNDGTNWRIFSTRAIVS